MRLTGQPGEEFATLTVGVTGHRFLAETAKLRAAVDEALDVIHKQAPQVPLTIMSLLAEGADRMVAEVGLERGVDLIVPLPLPRDEYIKDFDTPESRREFLALLDRAERVVEMPLAASRVRAYEQAGEWVLDRSDAIIAIWDGRPARSVGSTADIAQRAIDRGMTVFHIMAGNRRPGTQQQTTLGADQGRLVIYGR